MLMQNLYFIRRIRSWLGKSTDQKKLAMSNHIYRCRALAVVFAVAAVLTGCGKSSHQTPPKQQVQDAVAGGLPSYVSLRSLELEPIATGPESVKVNFKAGVAVNEDLYQVERAVTGTPKVTLLKLVQAEGTKRNLYGFVVAHRFMDQWTLEAPQLQADPHPFGKPREAFKARAYVTGTAEANAALAAADQERQAQKAALEREERESSALAEREERAQKARAALQALEDQARRARLEQARLAFEEQGRKEAEQRKQAEAQRQQEAAAARQKLVLATVPGARYLGTKTGYNASVQRIRLVFTEQKDALLRAEVINPDDPNEKRMFTGELRFNTKPEKDGAVAYAIVMDGLRTHKPNPNPNSIFDRSLSLKLQLTADGLEGIADAGLGEQFPLCLQREGTAPATAPSPAASKPGSEAKNQGQ
jgi:hypothetical protein